MDNIGLRDSVVLELPGKGKSIIHWPSFPNRGSLHIVVNKVLLQTHILLFCGLLLQVSIVDGMYLAIGKQTHCEFQKHLENNTNMICTNTSTVSPDCRDGYPTRFATAAWNVFVNCQGWNPEVFKFGDHNLDIPTAPAFEAS